MKQTLTYFLRKYAELQENIFLVYHPDAESYWSDRCQFLDEKYDPNKPYNHRSILDDEIVIEFDEGEWRDNLKLAKTVASRLKEDGIPYTMWHSGNKSYHVHFFIDPQLAKDVPTLKKCVMRYYSRDLPLPDLQLAAPRHLVRAEHGIHEKTGKQKRMIDSFGPYPQRMSIPDPIWMNYSAEVRRRLTSSRARNAGSLKDHPGVKYLLTSHEFREAQDGRERALFLLIHVLKPTALSKEALVAELQTWYRYSSTKPGLSPREIERKVLYHWTRTYHIGFRQIDEFLESIGRTDLCQSRVTPFKSVPSTTTPVGVVQNVGYTEKARTEFGEDYHA